MPATDSSLYIIASSGGQTWSYKDKGSCPTLQKVFQGDGDVSWTSDFTQGVDTIPPRQAQVTVWDDIGIVQTARLKDRKPPSALSCDGQASFTGESPVNLLTDRHFDSTTRFGPRWNVAGSLTAPESLGTTPEDAVVYAITQRAGGLSVGTIATTGRILEETEDFYGRTPQDVLNSMAAAVAGLATPIVWNVRGGFVNWGPLNIAPQYEVLIADGADVTPSDDTGRLFSQVVVLFGHGDSVTWPEVADYSAIPSLVDITINVGSEIVDRATALQIAQGTWARVADLELGWTWNFTIPLETPIEHIGYGREERTWRIPAGVFLRIPDLNPQDRWGAHARMPNVHLITSLTWDGTAGQLTGTAGEIRTSAAKLNRNVRRQSIAGGASRYVTSTADVQSIPLRDNNKLRLLTPPLIDASGKVTTKDDPLHPPVMDYTDSSKFVDEHGNKTPPPVDVGAVPVATKQQTVLPTAEPPKPPATVIGLNAWDELGDNQPVPVFPMQIEAWEMHCNIAATVEVSLKLLSTGVEIFRTSLTAEKDKTTVLTVASNPRLRIDHDDGILPEVTIPDTNEAIKWVVIFLRQTRRFPGYPKGADTGLVSYTPPS